MNSSAANFDTIKKTVQSVLPECRVLLFGSRARGDYDRHSDYDLLVITPGELTKTERLSWLRTIDKALLQSVRAPFDLLLYSEGEINEKKEIPGHIIRTAIREGIAL